MTISEALVMSQWVKHLPHCHEDVRWDSHHPHKRGQIWLPDCGPLPRKQRQGILGVKWVDREAQSARDPALGNKVEPNWRRHTHTHYTHRHTHSHTLHTQTHSHTHCTHRHTHTHTHSHTLTHTQRHIHSHTHCTHRETHTDTLTYSHTHSHTETHTHSHTQTHTLTHTDTYTHTQRPTQTQTQSHTEWHTDIHTHTHTHTHTYFSGTMVRKPGERSKKKSETIQWQTGTWITQTSLALPCIHGVATDYAKQIHMQGLRKW